ncbi:MAG: hypothetical protein VB957_07080 [Pseudomonadales bacterium]
MNEEEFTETVAKAQLAWIAKGKMIFKQADKDSKVYWLVAGSLDLLDEKFEARNFKSDDENAKNPIDNESPHRFTAVTTGKSRILTIER